MTSKEIIRLHPLIPNKDLPAALKRPLKFGDREQIEAIQDIECKLTQMATEKALRKTGKLKKYAVSVEITYDNTIEIYATSKQDAIEKVQDDYDFSDVDFDTFYSAKIVKERKYK